MGKREKLQFIIDHLSDEGVEQLLAYLEWEFKVEPRSLNHLHPKASYIQCDKCGRKSKSEKVNKVCGMPQPNGSICDGWLMGHK